MIISIEKEKEKIGRKWGVTHGDMWVKSIPRWETSQGQIHGGERGAGNANPLKEMQGGLCG